MDPKEARLHMPNGMDVPHMRLSGNLTFINPDGNYLNAEQQPMLGFYIAVTFVYGGLLTFWVARMRKFAEHVILLHTVILVLLAICLS
jgi:hypothetical protein